MSFLSGLIKRAVTPNYTMLLADKLSKTFVERPGPPLETDGTPIICICERYRSESYERYEAIETECFNELYILAVILFRSREDYAYRFLRYNRDNDPQQPLLEKVETIYRDAVEVRDQNMTGQPQQRFLSRNMLRYNMLRVEAHVIKRFRIFIQAHQKAIACLQKTKTEDPVNYSKDLEELSKSGQKKVASVLRFLADNRLEEPGTAAGAAAGIDKAKFVIVDQALMEPTQSTAAGAVEPEPARKPAEFLQLSPAELQKLAERPKINNETTDLDIYLYPL